ncbi:HvfA family oxazolone/thioamide-modified RiPP metallophore [Peristeroidobacter agariperforans]|uniref:HvfA family oxazolone/thioamide-modified RiPP metallophore n=1 Tax=Peristeroidobacter agariperforans TaxID=268404 RepID=UPI00101CAE4E|nr:EF-hand domain-containing protein [Peristeroidobacter agariperforans]
MSKNSSSNKAGLGAVGIALTGGMLLASSAFAAQPMAHGYLLTAAPTSKTAEGKCGEGKCGGSKAAAKTAEGKCGEGKCGEGKCGDESFARTDANNDGKVSKAEFLAVAPEREAAFVKIDTDKNGFISQAEAYKFLRSVYEANGKEMPADKFSIAAVLGK